MKFTISSGPFGVPLIKHVIIVKGDSAAQIEWNWMLLKPELESAFPFLAKCSDMLIMAKEYDEETRQYPLYILSLVEFEEQILRDICDRVGGEYL
ncbi:hypothetical protein V7O61_08345 [Methanolobus sp. WCC1]|jgi:hypothetical protein|uniref:hypothetical protein n=1 Tax=unclassified Methanolobus TaxID=2629569 RepID=UPI0032529D01